MIAHALLAATLLSPAGQGYKAQAGPYKPEFKSLVLHDSARKKDLPIRVTYPSQEGSYPLIVFSHGYGASRENYRPLVDHWVGHGYVCIQPTHSDSLSQRPAVELRKAANLSDPRNFADWKNRPADVKFVLDSIAELGRRVPALSKRLDRSRVGIGGHSYGAHTSQLMAGAKTIVGGPFVEERSRAFLLISPQGPGSLLTKQSWKDIRSPVMVVTGSKDVVRTGDDPETRKAPFEFSAPGDKFLVWIDGANHMFGGIAGARRPGIDPGSPSHLAYVRSASLAFWDAYLKSDAAAKAYLASSSLKDWSDGAVTLSRR
jgi:predicted dienelactone hydrolase